MTLFSMPQATSGQRSAGQGREGRAGQGRAGQGRAGQGRAGQGRAGQGRAGQGRAGQGRAGQGRAGQGRAGQGRAGQGRAGRHWGRLGQVWGRSGRGQGQFRYCESHQFPLVIIRLFFRLACLSYSVSFMLPTQLDIGGVAQERQRGTKQSRVAEDGDCAVGIVLFRCRLPGIRSIVQQIDGLGCWAGQGRAGQGIGIGAGLGEGRANSGIARVINFLL